MLAEANSVQGGTDFIHNGMMPEYELPSNLRTQKSTSEKALFVRIWDAYRANYNQAMQASALQMQAGHPFIAGFTKGAAHTDVVVDVVSVASLGYGAVRLAPGAVKAGRVFVARHEFRSPLVFRYEAGKFYSGPPLYAQRNSSNLAKNNLLFSKSARMDFAPTGYLDGQFYPANQLPILGNYLYKRGVDVVTITRGSPAFQAANRLSGKPTLYFPENPTVLQIKHELSHWLDCKKLGVEKYSKLSTFEKEQMVLDRLKNNRIWKQVLNDEEIAFSVNYVDGLKPENVLKNEIGVKNVD